MNKEQTQDISLFKTLNYFLAFYVIYILIGFCIYYLAVEEANQAIEKAPEHNKQEVFSSRMTLYSHFL